jgi:hypothetical protein
MITLQAAAGENPAIEWDETNTDLYSQTQEAQNWVQQNIMNTESVNTMETVVRPSGRADLERIKLQTYTTAEFTLVIDRTYRSVENCAVLSATYTLTEI